LSLWLRPDFFHHNSIIKFQLRYFLVKMLLPTIFWFHLEQRPEDPLAHHWNFKPRNLKTDLFSRAWPNSRFRKYIFMFPNAYSPENGPNGNDSVMVFFQDHGYIKSMFSTMCFQIHIPKKHIPKYIHIPKNMFPNTFIFLKTCFLIHTYSQKHIYKLQLLKVYFPFYCWNIQPTEKCDCLKYTLFMKL